MSTAKRAVRDTVDPFEVFGVFWAGAFDEEGCGPESTRLVLYRLRHGEEIGSVAFGLHGAVESLLSLTPDAARRLASAITLAADSSVPPTHDRRELTAGGGPDKLIIGARGKDGVSEKIRAANGFRFPDSSLGVWRPDHFSSWSLTHTLSGYAVALFDSFTDAWSAARELTEAEKRGEFDLGDLDPHALEKVAALKLAVCRLPGRVDSNGFSIPVGQIGAFDARES